MSEVKLLYATPKETRLRGLLDRIPKLTGVKTKSRIAGRKTARQLKVKK